MQPVTFNNIIVNNIFILYKITISTVFLIINAALGMDISLGELLSNPLKKITVVQSCNSWSKIFPSAIN